MSLFFIDTFDITPVVSNPTYKNTTESAGVESLGYIEEQDRVIRSSDGSPMKPERMIMMP